MREGRWTQNRRHAGSGSCRPRNRWPPGGEGFRWLGLAACVLLVLLAPLAAAAEGIAQVSAVSLSSQPVEPGAGLTITVSYYNPTGSSASGFTTELGVPSAFTIKSETLGLTPGTALCAYCTADNTYFLHVASDAAVGTYRLQAKATSGGFSSVKNIDVEVRGKPNLLLNAVAPRVELLEPDKPFDLVLVANNVGTGPAFEVTLSSSSTAVIALGSGRQSIPRIAPGANGSVTIPMVVSASTVPGAYQLAFALTFKDAGGAVNSTSQNIGVRVVEVGELAVQNVKVADPKGQPLLAGPAVVIVRIENTGHGDAEAVQAALSCGFNGGEKKAFLGRLKPDEDGPAVFEFASVPAGEHECTLTLRSQDDLGEHVSETTLAVHAGPADLSGLSIPAVIVLLALGFVFRKRLKALAGRGK